VSAGRRLGRVLIGLAGAAALGTGMLAAGSQASLKAGHRRRSTLTSWWETRSSHLDSAWRAGSSTTACS
jgi:hypothetical protein